MATYVEFGMPNLGNTDYAFRNFVAKTYPTTAAGKAQLADEAFKRVQAIAVAMQKEGPTASDGLRVKKLVHEAAYLYAIMEQMNVDWDDDAREQAEFESLRMAVILDVCCFGAVSRGTLDTVSRADNRHRLQLIDLCQQLDRRQAFRLLRDHRHLQFRPDADRVLELEKTLIAQIADAQKTVAKLDIRKEMGLTNGGSEPSLPD